MTSWSSGISRRNRLVLLFLPFLLEVAACERGTDPESVRHLLDRGREEQAETLARAHLQQETELHGAESPPAARALDLLVEVRLRRGLADQETRDLAERALALEEADPDGPPLELASALAHLAQVQARTGDPAGALPLVERARDLRVESLGPEDAAVGEALAIESLVRLLQGDAAAGGEAAERSLRIRRAALGPRSREVAESLILVSYAAQQSGEMDRCLELRREALKIREDALGPWHPEVGGALLALGEILIHRQDPEARPVLERALEVLERARGPADPGVRIALNNLALVVQGEGDLPYARSLYERRLSLPDAGGVRDLAVWQNLGSVLWQMGELRAGREAYEKALSLAEESGATRDGLAIHQHNLAFALTLEGRFEEARALLETALAAQIEAHGPDDHRALAGMEALGNVLRETGDLLGARRLYQRALDSETRDPDAPPGAGANLRFHLGEVRWALGDLPGARHEMEEALAAMETNHPAGSPDVAVALDKLADLLLEMGELGAARVDLERLRELHARQQGKNGARVARVEARLAAIEGDVSRRIEMLDTARRRLAAQYGENHPDVAALDVRLAQALSASGQLPAARQRLEEARAIQLAVYGPDHPELARTEIELGRVVAEGGDVETGLDLALRGERAGLDHLRAAIGGLPEREALAFARTRPSGLDLAAGLAARPPGDAATVRRVWSAVIRARARVLDEIASRQRLARRGRSPELQERVSALIEARSWLARLLVQGPGTNDPGDYPERLAQARDRAEEAEGQLAAALEPYRDETDIDRAGWEEVAASLPQGTALVAFLRYDAPPERYLAFAQVPGGQPRVLVLGDAGPIDAAVSRWRDAATTRPPAGRAGHLRAEASYREVAQDLARLVWTPLSAAIEGARTVFVVPDGSLFRVSFPALTVDGESYLLESGPRIHLLGAERDLIDPAARPAVGRGLLVVGAPEFGTPPAPTPSSPDRGCPALDSIVVPTLPGTAQEVQSIGALWETDPSRLGEVERLTGEAAREDAVRARAPGHRILHFATHGFFLDRRCSTGPAVDRPPVDPWARGYEPGDGPLVLSGLALAGFNRRALAREEEDDGVLTAEEIAGIDLGGVEWAVLSACDTGTGTIQAREGVLGLQRAFRTAGVRSIVLSLWPVEDDSSRAWMERLYAARADGASTTEAVHLAALGTLQERRGLGLGGHPFYWGGFVASGDWR